MVLGIKENSYWSHSVTGYTGMAEWQSGLKATGDDEPLCKFPPNLVSFGRIQRWILSIFQSICDTIKSIKHRLLVSTSIRPRTASSSETIPPFTYTNRRFHRGASTAANGSLFYGIHAPLLEIPTTNQNPSIGHML
ncbi:hypothetical protein GJ744_006573 [Endocarpon pusillum]|uniref:Uncharacterized protein n=1 Tax=Endocarpon pusillum TaxID=364733 RepID=A0A8H7AT95_9EURO|nr:hypothetical protein GJ744_006573 [Endocarpon pusillum]